MNRSLKLVFPVVVLMVSGCNTVPTKEQAQAVVIKHTPEHFYATATIKNAYLDTTATITTQNGFQEKHGLLGIVWDDNFLRGIIDKKTGQTTIQLYQVLSYRGAGWRFYQSANYENVNGPTATPLTVIGRNVDCTGARYGGCTYTEHVAFTVPEPLLREIAQKYSPGALTGWRFKFNPKAGEDFDAFMLPAEIIGFLRRLDEFRAGQQARK